MSDTRGPGPRSEPPHPHGPARTRPPARVLVAGVVLVALPVLQLAVERSTSLPLGPSRMLSIAIWLLAWGPVALFALERGGLAPRSRASRLAVALLVTALGLAHLLAFARLLDGPFGPVPGGPLRGPVADWPPPDLSTVRAARYAELEVRPEHPRSLETLVLVHDEALYVAANTPGRKRWPTEVREDGRVRIRVDGRIHERRARFVEDAPEREALLAAMNAKYGFDVSLDGPIWFFRLDAR